MGPLKKVDQYCDDAWPLARMYFFAKRAKVLPKDENLALCYEVLNKVSRRYAVAAANLSQRSLVIEFELVIEMLMADAALRSSFSCFL